MTPNHIYITCGDYCNTYYQKHVSECSVPFNEAFNKGNPQPPLFTKEFIKDRCRVLDTTDKIYKDKLKGVFDFMKHHTKYAEVTLVFGKDEFCQYNLRGALWMLQQIRYDGTVTIQYIDEKTYAPLEKIENIDIANELHKLGTINTL
ncbi:MAG: hypothetical protein II942_03505 [Alphaproteobacteria bacterium]|nr:hypothetical protein [Alphaproteobacteria bacterium]